MENGPVTAAATVERMFAAFAAGDLDALLATVHPASRWVYHGANPTPTSAEFVGHAAVRRFFEGILKRRAFTRFDATEYVSQGNTVIVLGSEAGVIKATGEPFHNEWAQQYMVEGGLIVAMKEWNIQVDAAAPA